MKNISLALVMSLSLGMTGAALAAAPSHIDHHSASLAGNSVVLPSQRPAYLAQNEDHQPSSMSRHPAYLA